MWGFHSPYRYGICVITAALIHIQFSVFGAQQYANDPGSCIKQCLFILFLLALRAPEALPKVKNKIKHGCFRERGSGEGRFERKRAPSNETAPRGKSRIKPNFGMFRVEMMRGLHYREDTESLWKALFALAGLNKEAAPREESLLQLAMGCKERKMNMRSLGEIK